MEEIKYYLGDDEKSSVDLRIGDDFDTEEELLFIGECLGSYDDIPDDKAVLSKKCSNEKEIGTITNVPEFKVKWKIRRIGFIKTKVPQLFRRTKKIKAYGRICYPTGLSNDIEKEILECFVIALVPTAPVAIATGGAAALPVFWSAFNTCLATKVEKEILDAIDASIFTRTSHGDWHAV